MNLQMFSLIKDMATNYPLLILFRKYELVKNLN